jgi:hypothetical protein
VQPATVAPRDSLPRTTGNSMPEVTPPTPIIPRMTPYIPGPRSRSRRTNSGSSAHGAEAGIEYDAVRIIAAWIAGVLRTNRMPARIAETKCSRGKPVNRRSRRHTNKALITARIDTAYIEKARLDPPSKIRKPAIAGPTARVRL